MSEIKLKDGGPAFPVPMETAHSYPGTRESMEGDPGMTLRQWYAGQALVGLLANPKNCELLARQTPRGESMAPTAAALADEYAVAMLELQQRERESE